MHFKASHRLSINLVSGLFNFSQFSLFFQGFDDSHRFLFCSIIVNISTEPNVSILFVERLQLKVFLVNFRKVQSFQQSCFCGWKFAAILFACFETVAALKQTQLLAFLGALLKRLCITDVICVSVYCVLSWCTFEEVLTLWLVGITDMLFVYLCTLNVKLWLHCWCCVWCSDRISLQKLATMFGVACSCNPGLQDLPCDWMIETSLVGIES